MAAKTKTLNDALKLNNEISKNAKTVSALKGMMKVADDDSAKAVLNASVSAIEETMKSKSATMWRIIVKNLMNRATDHDSTEQMILSILGENSNSKVEVKKVEPMDSEDDLTNPVS